MNKEVDKKPKDKREYIPAAGKDWRLPLYDPLCKLIGIDSEKKKLIDQAAIQPNQRILDIGCGTGTLILMIKRLYPDLDITGLDPDPKALKRAKRKLRRRDLRARFDQGFSDALPYPDSGFDRVFSSLMLHHLSGTEKEATLFEVHRVLKPAGSFHLLDFEQREGSKKKLFATAAQHQAFLKRAGFLQIRREAQKETLLGRIAFYRAEAGHE